MAEKKMIRSDRASPYRRIQKPLVEKKRRDRINHALSEMKGLVLEALKRDTTEKQFEKMEKADILEMTVQHLRRAAGSPLPGTEEDSTERYLAGFQACLREVSSVLRSMPVLDDVSRMRIVEHLHKWMPVGVSRSVTPSHGGGDVNVPRPPSSLTAATAGLRELHMASPDVEIMSLSRDAATVNSAASWSSRSTDTGSPSMSLNWQTNAHFRPITPDVLKVNNEIINRCQSARNVRAETMVTRPFVAKQELPPGITTEMRHATQAPQNKLTGHISGQPEVFVSSAKAFSITSSGISGESVHGNTSWPSTPKSTLSAARGNCTSSGNLHAVKHSPFQTWQNGGNDLRGDNNIIPHSPSTKTRQPIRKSPMTAMMAPVSLFNNTQKESCVPREHAQYAHGACAEDQENMGPGIEHAGDDSMWRPW